MVVEAWIAFLGAGGQRYPGLYAVHVRPVNTHVFKSFAVRDTAARDHPVDLAGADFLFETEAVAMGDLARIKIGHGRKADMRVRAHIEIARDAGRQFQWPHMIEKDERPDHPARGEVQNPPDDETAAQITFAHVDRSEEHTSDLQSLMRDSYAVTCLN